MGDLYEPLLQRILCFNSPMKKVAIIGNGIAGVTAARYIRKFSDFEITLISKETDHFFSRTALMYIYMGHMRYQDTKPYEDHFWKKNRIDLLRDYVESVDIDRKELKLSSGSGFSYDVLVIASGSTFNKFGWPGQDLKGVGGLYSFQDLEYMETHTKGISRGVIVGGGLIGIEMAEMLLSRDIPVTFLVREKSYWDNVLPAEESAIVSRHIREHHVDLRLATELKEILDDGTGKVKGVMTNTGEVISCEWVGLTAGVHPNKAFLEGSGIETGRGVLVNDHLETNVPDVYAIGDCAEFQKVLPGRTKLEQVWYTGKMQGETVAMTITGNRRAYTPGNWFNSAKFFDIEYQVYGDIPTTIPEGVKSLYWEHSSGKRSVRINYDAQSGSVLGFNLMGIRYRHEVCDRWISDGTQIEVVLQDLGAANFDPEFFKQYESEVVALHNEKNPGRDLVLKKKRGLKHALAVLSNR